MTTTSAAIAIPEKHMNLETMLSKITPFMGMGNADEYLMCYKPENRDYKWWWDVTVDPNHEMDFKTLGNGPRIFTGGVSKTTCDPNLIQQRSEVMVVGDDGEPEWIALVVQVRGSYEVTIDVMVHRDVKIKEIIEFLVSKFRLKEIPSTEMFIWAMDNHGRVNVEDLDGQLNLNLTHTSPVMEMPFGKVFKTMQEAGEKMCQITDIEESEDHEIPYEWQLVENMTMTLWDAE